METGWEESGGNGDNFLLRLSFFLDISLLFLTKSFTQNVKASFLSIPEHLLISFMCHIPTLPYFWFYVYICVYISSLFYLVLVPS